MSRVRTIEPQLQVWHDALYEVVEELNAECPALSAATLTSLRRRQRRGGWLSLERLAGLLVRLGVDVSEFARRVDRHLKVG